MNGIISKLIIATTTLFLVALAGCQPPADDSIYFVHSDHLNVPTVVTDKDKAIVWEGHRKPFGDTEVTVATIEQPFRFPGQYYDSETGLHYNLMRDYDPQLGRYVQSDPIGLDGGINTYGYAYQNPLKYTDPDGLNPGAGAGILGGLAACMRIPACRNAVKEAVEKCKDVRCKVVRHTAHHKFPGLGYCEHIQIVCWVKGGGQLFRAQFPLPGRCSPDKSPGDWLPDKSGDIPFDEMPFGE